MSAWITVPEVMRELGVEADARVSWSIGAAVRDMYEAAHGTLPPKALRPKTNGRGGSHCFAVYPPEWAPRIADVVRSHVTVAARQGDLF